MAPLSSLQENGIKLQHYREKIFSQYWTRSDHLPNLFLWILYLNSLFLMKCWNQSIYNFFSYIPWDISMLMLQYLNICSQIVLIKPHMLYVKPDSNICWVLLFICICCWDLWWSVVVGFGLLVAFGCGRWLLAVVCWDHW